MSGAALEAARRRAATRGGAWIVGGTVRDALLGRPPPTSTWPSRATPGAAASALARAARRPRLPALGGVRRLARRRRGRGVAGRPVAAAGRLDRGRPRAARLHRQRDRRAARRRRALDPARRPADLAARHAARWSATRALDADPLRPLRLARLATELGLRPDAARRARARPRPPSRARRPERIFAELRRIVIADRVAACARGRARPDAAVLPELGALHGVEQSHFHHLDVHGHTLEVLERAIGSSATPRPCSAPTSARGLQRCSRSRWPTT